MPSYPHTTTLHYAILALRVRSSPRSRPRYRSPSETRRPGRTVPTAHSIKEAWLSHAKLAKQQRDQSFVRMRNVDFANQRGPRPIKARAEAALHRHPPPRASPHDADFVQSGTATSTASLIKSFDISSSQDLYVYLGSRGDSRGLFGDPHELG
ncbi:hypothetical protein BU26DRAFT_44493 [Trematosphaeria pertusa]|uniref:Uncharacterized protein n=1 Tax=Trematosphaeria pertusa TaxID=390896 RepID=A0A6A6I8V2_9PLEO|nr:uncharacterized protein BU26DRAFT_44493 [Trematosphaeria pertusa]KAF2246372.1 hypothetical protein BU26DRAFT_44493 [Trematosphaeria pertusa]